MLLFFTNMLDPFKKSSNEFSGIFPLRSLSDNYIWVIVNRGTAIVIDPGESEPVLHFLNTHNLQLTAILVTHHHYDHTAGISKLAYRKNITVYGPSNEHNSFPCNVFLKEGDILNFPNIEMNIAEIPGHTNDHIAYYGQVLNFPSVLFCGDTLFSGGCGQVFDGTYYALFKSLKRLSSLPLHTKIYCGHEYTCNNLQWAIQIDPNNLELRKYYAKISLLEKDGYPTLPSSIEIELKINPFLRIQHPDIVKAISLRTGFKVLDPLIAFSELRKWKNSS